MSDAVLVAIIMLAGSTVAGLWAWLRGRRKSEVETEASKQVALSERYDDASDLAKYVQEQVKAAVEEAVAPLRKQIEELKAQNHRVHDAFRSFFTKLWVWDRNGRIGQMPAVDPQLMEELRLAHLLELPFD